MDRCVCTVWQRTKTGRSRTIAVLDVCIPLLLVHLLLFLLSQLCTRKDTDKEAS